MSEAMVKITEAPVGPAAVRQLGSEALCQVALLMAVYLAMVLLVRADAEEWLVRLGMLGRQAVIDTVLVIGCCALVYGVLSFLPSDRVRSWAFTAFVLCCYVVFAAQMVFFRETGTLFSGQVALYALGHLGELVEVISMSASNFASAAIVIVMLAVFAVSVLALRRPKWQLRSLPLLLLPVLVVALQIGTMNQQGGGRALASESLLVALVQPAYPRVAGGDIPVYVPPSVAEIPASDDELPDIVLVVLESTRAISVPPFDSGTGPRAEMPQLAALARESRVFKRAYTTTSHTSKALVGILCGVHPHPEMPIIESHQDGLPVDCLPKILGRAGYRSLFIQSATEHFENRRALLANMGFETALFKQQIEDGYASSGYFGLDEAALPPNFAKWWSEQGATPRFATILTSMTHHPYQEIGKPAPTDPEAQRQAYLNVMAYTDGVLKEIIETIRASGRAGNTILIVTGDHGESFGEHGPRQHDSVPFEEVTRVPLLVWDGRGHLPVGEDDALRQHVDLLPTLAGMTGAEVSGGTGRDLFDPEGHPHVVTSCWYAGACMSRVEQSIKWIYAPSNRLLLAFDLAADPDETRNLADDRPLGERQAVAMELLRHQESVRQFHDSRPSAGAPSSAGQLAR